MPPGTHCEHICCFIRIAPRARSASVWECGPDPLDHPNPGLGFGLRTVRSDIGPGTGSDGADRSLIRDGRDSSLGDTDSSGDGAESARNPSPA